MNKDSVGGILEEEDSSPFGYQIYIYLAFYSVEIPEHISLKLLLFNAVLYLFF